MVMPPPHQQLANIDWQRSEDAAGYFPTAESAKDYAARIASEAYHRDRLRALKYLSARIPCTDVVLDYGIGDGGLFLALNLSSSRVVGTDISPHMIDLARQSLAMLDFTGLVDSVEVLNDLISGSFDLVLCLNVLGYLTEGEHDTFFLEAHRVLKPGGHLLLMTGNELFDLYALNAGTVEFFSKHFKQDTGRLLTYATAERFKNASRRNPLSVGAQLAEYRLSEVAQTFSQWHSQIPTIANIEHGGDLHKAYHAARDHSFDANQLPERDSWKALFRCSMFASLSTRE